MFGRYLQRLTLKRIGGNTGDTKSLNTVKSAGVLFHDIIVDTGGDIELIEVFASESASGGFHAR